MKEQPMSDKTPMGQVIQIDEARIRDHLGEMVRGTVEETLNALLDAEADRLCGAGGYERTQGRQLRTLAAHLGRGSEPQGSEAEAADLRDGHHRAYRRRESSVEEALAGISVRRVE